MALTMPKHVAVGIVLRLNAIDNGEREFYIRENKDGSASIRFRFTKEPDQGISVLVFVDKHGLTCYDEQYEENRRKL